MLKSTTEVPFMCNLKPNKADPNKAVTWEEISIPENSLKTQCKKKSVASHLLNRIKYMFRLSLQSSSCGSQTHELKVYTLLYTLALNCQSVYALAWYFTLLSNVSSNLYTQVREFFFQYVIKGNSMSWNWISWCIQQEILK